MTTESKPTLINASVLAEAVTQWFIRRRVYECPRCYGKGVQGGGRGHFGDCNGDAGEAWKPCWWPCPRCLGFGWVDLVSEIEYRESLEGDEFSSPKYSSKRKREG
jgi:hypothetical protein